MTRVCLLAILLAGAMCAAAQAQEKKTGPTLSGAGGAAGIGQYPPDAWGVIAATISNPTDTERELLVTFNFEETATLQFAAQAWLPPQTRRVVWVPMRTNTFEVDEHKTNQLPLRQQLLDPRGDQNAVLDEQRGMLIAARDRWITGMIADGDVTDDDSVSAALAMRRALEMSRRLAYLNEQSLPPMVAGWQGLNALIICKDKPAFDSAQVEALRQWLLSGGRLWVMIEQVDPDAMAAILGDAWTLRVVDHVPLSTVMIEPPGAAAIKVVIDDSLALSLNGRKIADVSSDEKMRTKSLELLKAQLRKVLDEQEDATARRVHLRITGGVSGEIATDLNEAITQVGDVQLALERDYENPIDMARVLAPDMEVVHRVNGWPASLRKPVGKGWLLVTTVGPRAWCEPLLIPQVNLDGTETKNEKNQTIWSMGHDPNPPLRDLANWFHTDRRADTLPPAAFDQYVGEQIGYSIVGRGTVLAVLCVFCLALLGNGLWLARSGRLEHLGWVGAGIAVVITVILIVIGRSNQTSVPMTVAQAQFVQVAPDQQQAIVSGQVSVYNPGDGTASAGDAGEGGSNARLEASAGGLILPENLDYLATRQVQMVWTDVDRWHWRNVTMPVGATRRATFERVTPLARPVRAKVTFDKDGVVGFVERGELSELSGVLIATPAGVMATKTRAVAAGELHGYGDGAFVATPAEVMAAGQYASGGVLDESQRRRQEVLRELLGAPEDFEDDISTAATPATKPGTDASTSKKRGAGRVSLGRTRSIQFPASPTLLAWTDALPLGFQFSDARQRIGSALVSIPLSIERPAAGTAVTIPSPFLPYRLARGKYGGTATVFSEDRRTWNSSSTPGTVPLAFKVPAELLPLRVEKASFKLDVNAPGATVDVQVERGGALMSVIKVSSPVSPIVVDLPVDSMQPNEQGEVVVVFRVNYQTKGENQLWRVREVKLELKGEVK